MLDLSVAGEIDRVNSRLALFNVSSDQLDLCPHDFATVRLWVPPLCRCMSLSLPSGDEPMVVPDTHSDWRFAKNVRRELSNSSFQKELSPDC
jgi:hypothetical protein